MISTSDMLQVLSELHQYSMLLVELKDATTFGVAHSGEDRLSYFKIIGSLSPKERRDLVQRIHAGLWPDTIKILAVEDFLLEIDGKRSKHIWLEAGGSDRRELAFVSISELKAYFRSHSHH